MKKTKLITYRRKKIPYDRQIDSLIRNVKVCWHSGYFSSFSRAMSYLSDYLESVSKRIKPEEKVEEDTKIIYLSDVLSEFVLTTNVVNTSISFRYSSRANPLLVPKMVEQKTILFYDFDRKDSYTNSTYEVFNLTGDLKALSRVELDEIHPKDVAEWCDCVRLLEFNLSVEPVFEKAVLSSNSIPSTSESLKFRRALMNVKELETSLQEEYAC